MKITPHRWLLLATAILLLASLLRLVALHDVPPGLAQDEILNADIVELIRAGNHALFFREGYGHEPLYHYYSVPFQVLLGDNVLSIRLPAFTLGLLLIAGILRWLKRDASPSAALLVGAWLAVSWWAILFSRVGLRPILTPLLLVGMAWFWSRRPFLAGIFLALTVYTYTPARLYCLLPLLMVASALIRRQYDALRQPSIILVVMGLLALPLVFTLRADPTLQERVTQLLGPLDALQAGDPQPLLQTTLATAGVFSFTGDPRWTYTLPNQPLLDPLTGLLFYAGILLLLTQRRRPHSALWLIWLGVGLLPSAVTPDAPSLIRMIGALPVVYLLPAIALTTLYKRHPALATLLAVGALSLTFARTWQQGFQQWANAPETHDKYQTVYWELVQYGQAHDWSAPVISDSRIDPIDDDTIRRNANHDPQARWVQNGQALIWPQGQATTLYAPEYAPPHPVLLSIAGIDPVPLYRSDQQPSFAVWQLPMPPAPTDQPILFADHITWLGMHVTPDGIITHWQVEQPLPSDLSIFLHVLDDAGNILTQHDGLDAIPDYLQSGDQFWQWHPLTMPANASALQLGLYTRHDNQRFLHASNPPTDRLIIPLFP